MKEIYSKATSPKVRNYRFESKEIILYLIFGSTGAISDFIIFKTLVDKSIDPLVSNVLSTCCGIGVSFLLNSRYTFSEAIKLKTFMRFFLIGLVGLAFSSLYLKCLIAGFGITPSYAKASSLPLIAGLQYSGNRLWTFKKS
jgi:putative flippase GtrA